MNTFLIIIYIIIGLSLTIGLIYLNTYNRICEYLIKIEEVDKRIDTTLKQKYDVFNKSISMIKETANLDDKKFTNIIKLRSRKISNFNLYKILYKEIEEFNKLYESNKSLKENNDIYKLKKDLESLDESLTTLTNYYNNTTNEYNKTIKSFPNNIIANIKNLREKILYTTEEGNDNIDL